MSNEYRAPALARGIEVLRALADGGAQTLQELARRVEVPKSSLLRVLDTLIALDCARRDGATKRYESCCRLVPVPPSPRSRRRRLDRALHALARDTGATAEWYVGTESGLTLVQRAEPPSREVRVLATIGFRRSLGPELEAVACVGLAWHARGTGPRRGFWAHIADGKTGRLPPARARALIRSAAGTGCALDLAFNAQGVRRMAAVVLAGDTPLGVLALATSYLPGTDPTDTAALDELAAWAERLSEEPAISFDTAGAREALQTQRRRKR
jgi:DNA-binding IclR family transcriptional regulator